MSASVRNPPFATENLLENTDGVRGYSQWSIPPVFSRDGSLLPSIYADACSIHAVIVSKARGVGYTVGTLGMGWVMTMVPDQRHYLLAVRVFPNDERIRTCTHTLTHAHARTQAFHLHAHDADV